VGDDLAAGEIEFFATGKAALGEKANVLFPKLAPSVRQCMLRDEITTQKSDFRAKWRYRVFGRNSTKRWLVLDGGE
jgi:hypothetical protein